MLDGETLSAQTELLSKVARTLADAATDPASLLEALAVQVASALDAFCGFMRVEGDALVHIAMGVPAHMPIPHDALPAMQQRVPLAGDSLLARAVRTRETVQVAQVTDAHLRARYADEPSRDSARNLDTKGAMFVPVIVAGAVRGALSLVRRGPHAVPFDDDARQFAERLADHAALALANADLLQAARERAARLQLLSNLTREVAAAADDYPRLLDVIVRCVGQAMADSSSLRVTRSDGTGFLDAAVWDRDPEVEAFHRATLAAAANRSLQLLDRVLATNQPILIPHVTPSGWEGPARALVERIRPTSILAVPLREGGAPIAVLLLARSVGGVAFTPSDLALVEDIAAHATIAIANARALERSAKAAARLRVLTEASAAFATAHGDQRQILAMLARQLVDSLGGLCTIQLARVDGSTVEAETTIVHDDPAVVQRLHGAFGTAPREAKGFTRRILDGEVISISGTPRTLAAQAHPKFRALLEELDAHSIIGVPLQAGAAPIGAVLLIRGRGTPFTADDLRMAVDMVQHGALAVRNSRLLGSVQFELAERQRTERALRASEEQLRHAQKMEAVGRLAGGVAHDFNNLLSVVLSSCDFLEEAVPPGTPMLEDVVQIRQAGVRAANLTRQLLAFSRQQAIERRVIDLDEHVANLEPLLRRLLGEDCRVVIQLAGAVDAVFADPTHIEQVIMNLAINARDAMPRGGTLIIETANVELDAEAARRGEVAPGRYVALVVKDTGEGMTREIQERIFEPFFTTKARGKGTGLGLATVFGIVKQNGGAIAVESEVGIGTTFRVYFPRTEEVVKPFAVTGELPRIQGTETILVVEDEDAVRKTIVAILSRGGYRVIETTNGTEALASYEQHGGAIDLLLTDVVMPVMGGPELVQHLQARQAALKVLYMSGYTADKLDPHDLVDVALLPKPFTPSSVLNRVRQLLDG